MSALAFEHRVVSVIRHQSVSELGVHPPPRLSTLESRGLARFAGFWSFAVLALALITAKAAGPLDDWQWQNPRPQGNPLNGAAYGNGRFVAVGLAGAVLTSSDGINWTNIQSGISEDLIQVAYGNGKFVAIDSVGLIAESTDGVVWTTDRRPGIDYPSATAFCDNSFVILTGRVWTSQDGLAWASVNTGVTVTLSDIAFGQGMFVIVAPRVILTSTNRTTWWVSPARRGAL